VYFILVDLWYLATSSGKKTSPSFVVVAVMRSGAAAYSKTKLLLLICVSIVANWVFIIASYPPPHHELSASL